MTVAVWRLIRRSEHSGGGFGATEIAIANLRRAVPATPADPPPPAVRRSLAQAMSMPPPERADDIAARLARLVPIVRQRLDLAGSIDDAAILESLHEIAREKDPQRRWRAAYNSTVGLYLVLYETDLNAALNTLLALLPPRR